MKRELGPVTPGELLQRKFLEPMGISQYRLAKEIGVPSQRISEIVAGHEAITADTDLRLSGAETPTTQAQRVIELYFGASAVLQGGAGAHLCGDPGRQPLPCRRRL